MSDLPETRAALDDGAAGPQADLTGRTQMARNVLASWAGHLALILAGFMVPRIIDRRLSQTALGVWDFAWSTISYFHLVVLGVGSSIGRYVAKYRAVGDLAGLNRAVSSVTCVLVVMGTIVLALTAATALVVPRLLSRQLADFAPDARALLLLLGAAVAVRIASSSAVGVLQGCHRWGLHNAIEAGCFSLTVAGMVLVLLAGGSLVGVAMVSLCGDVLERSVRWVAAYRVCPGLRVRLAYARWSQARGMMAFGGKSFVNHMSRLLLNQTVNILIVAHLGPGALALFARPRTLVRQSVTVVRKFSNVLTPTASSLQAMGLHREIRSLLIRSTRYAAFISLPFVWMLVMLGGSVLRVWMGPAYAKGATVLTILALGNLALMVQRPVRNVLAGLNAHGRPGLVSLAAAIGAIPVAYVAMGPLRWGLVGAAGVVAAALVASEGVYLPIYACRRLGLGLRKYIFESMRGPVLCTLPFAACLLVIRIELSHRPVLALLCGAASGLLVLTPIYWHHALPAAFRRRLVEALLARVRRRGRAGA